MASKPQASSDSMLLRSSQGALDRRWVFLSTLFRKVLELSASEVQVNPDYQANGAWAGLAGRACERIARNMGGDVNVAPLCDLPGGLMAWIGFQERWDVLDGQRPYAFRQLGLTVHLGFKNDPIKPQIFRSEWMGIRDWNGRGATFHSPGAGHPHWQIDILETFRGLGEAQRFDFESQDEVEEFESSSDQDIANIVKKLTLEDMHFASAASWWLVQAQGNPLVHMNAPRDEVHLSRWLKACIEYIKQELLRCRLRSS